MSYVVPSVLVYQQLASSGGVANITPDLDACIIGPCYNVVDYVAGSTAALTKTAALTSSGAAAILANNAVTNTVYLGSGFPGQLVDSTSVSVYFNVAQVETKVVKVAATAASNTLTLATFTGTGSITTGTPTLTGVTNVTDLGVGDIVTIAGAGASGTALTSTILTISGTTVTLTDNASTTVTTAAITRTSFNNLNSLSSTLRVEAGDTAVITYGSTTLTTTVLSTISLGNTVTGIQTTDLMPAGITATAFVSIRKAFNNLLLPVVGPNSHTNYSLASVSVDGSVVINPLPAVSYGTVVTANIYIEYSALRVDLFGSVLDINNVTEQVGVLGEAIDTNPLALGVELALANTTTRIRAIAIRSNDLAGYLEALDLAASVRLYALVPLTQSTDILTAFKQHVEQLSTPVEASWRIALVNTSIPSVKYIGQYNPSLVNANGGNNTVSLVSGNYVLNSSNASFISDGVVAGDYIKITSHATAAQTVTSTKVLTVVSNQTLVIAVTIPLTAVNYYVQRNLTRSQQADIVAAQSHALTSSRVYHIQPDLVGVTISGATKYLPGYYNCCVNAGLIAGLPAQQGLTNIAPAGIVDLAHSNFYFTRAQMSTMAAAGTWLMVQENAGTIPYNRHSLSTDMSVLQYREIQQVKNMDFLSYFFYDILKSFPGRWNITNDTLQVLRTTINAGAKLLQGKKLPKVGAPLLDYQIKTLKQDPDNKDQVIIEMPVTMPTVMNYINLYLIY